MSSIDKRIVQMEFENQQFERNARTTIKTMDELKKNMDFKAASSSLKEFDNTSKHFNLGGISSAVSGIADRFSTLGIIGVTALQRITNKALDAGERIARAMTIEPVSTGFDEYELKMGSVQTIMASTGESLQTVNKYLDELNEYSDKTIYSFSDMTQNIGKFTNAGVKLEDAVAAIQGISNEAAVSGANAQEASRAMYNFAQALSAGYVKLIDWKSIENANMATVEFKNELIKTGLELGTITKKGDMYVTTTTNMNGKTSDAFNATHNFNEALNNQWMTTEVLTETLKKYADENTEIGKKAFAAAQDVKTLTMMWDTLKEAVQSGWAQTWESIIGDFNQAKEFLTTLTTFFSNIIDVSSKMRNQKLADWFELGGREHILSTIFALLIDIRDVIKPIKEAFREIFPAKTARDLYNISKAVRDFVINLRPSEEAMDKIKRTAKGLFAILDLGKTIISTLVNSALRIFNSVLGGSAENVLDVTASVGDLLTRFHDWVKENEFIEKGIGKVTDGIVWLIENIRNFINVFASFAKEQAEAFGIADRWNKFTSELKAGGGIIGALKRMGTAIQDYFASFRAITSFDDVRYNVKKLGKDIETFFASKWEQVGEIFDILGDKISAFLDRLGPFGKIVKNFGNGILAIWDKIVESLQKADFSKIILVGIGVGLIIVLNLIAKSISKIGDMLKPFGALVDSATGAIKSFSTRIKAESLKATATAILIMVGALAVLTKLDATRLWESAAVLVILAAALVAVQVTASKLGSTNWTVATNVLAFAGGLALVVAAINNLKLEGILAKLAVVTTIMAELALVNIAVSKFGGDNKGGWLSVAAVAGGLWIVVQAFEQIAGFSEGEIKRALSVTVTIIAALGIFAVLIQKANSTTMKFGRMKNVIGDVKATSRGSSGFGTMLGIVAALEVVLLAFKQIAGMDDGTITRGISVISDIFEEFAKLIVVSFLAGKNANKAGTMLIGVAVAMLAMYPTIKSLGSLNGGETQKAMSVIKQIAKVFEEIIVVSLFAGKNAGKAGLMLLAFSAALLIMPAVMYLIGSLDASAIDNGMEVIKQLTIYMDSVIAVSYLAQDSKGALIAIAVIFGILGGILITLSCFEDPSKVKNASESISLMIAAAALLVAVTKFADGVKLAGSTLVGVILILGLCATAIGLLVNLCPDLSQAMVASEGVSLLLVATAGAFWIVSQAKDGAEKASLGLIATSAALAIVATVIGLLAGIENVDKAIDIANSLSECMIVLAAVTFILTQIGKTGELAVEGGFWGALALDVVAIIIGALMALIGGLDDLLDGDLITALETGAEAFAILGKGIGELIKGILEGILQPLKEFLSFSLADIGSELGGFFTNAEPFFAGLRSMTPQDLTNAGVIADCIGRLSWANWEGIPDEETMKRTFTAIGGALKTFAEDIRDLDTDSVGKAAAAAEMMSSLERSLPRSGGKLQEWFGEKDLGAFGERLAQFADGMIKFTAKLKFVDTSNVASAADAGQLMADLENSLPRSDGKLQDWFGEKDLGTFGQRLVQFGEGLVKFTAKLRFVDPTYVPIANQIGTMMSDLENSLPRTDGVVAEWFIGGKGLDDFGNRLVLFADGLIDFTAKSKYIDASHMAEIMQIGTTLSDFESTLNPSGGIESWWNGEASLDTFGENLESFATSMKVYMENTKDVSVTENAQNFLAYIQDIVKATEDFTDVDAMAEDFMAHLHSLIEYFRNFAGDNSSDLEFGGSRLIYWMTKGLQNGLEVYATVIDRAGHDLAAKLDYAVKDGLGIASPAVTQIENGEWVDKGLAVGMEKNGYAESAAEGLANTVDSTITDGANKTLNTLESINKDYADWMDSHMWMVSSGIKMEQLSAVGMRLTGLIEEGTKDAINSVEDLDDNIVKPAKLTTNQLLEMNKALVDWYTEHKYLLNSGATHEELYALGREIVGLAGMDDVALPKVDPKPMLESVEEAKDDFFTVGTYLVQGLAEGIKSDMTAEEVMDQKAKNISDAFSKYFDEHDVTQKRLDLESQIWEFTEGKDATDIEKQEHQLQVLENQLKDQAKRVRDANAQYQTNVEVLGKDALETKKAWNEYLEAQVDMYEIVDKINEVQTGSTEITRETRFQIMDRYGEFMKSKDVMLASGITMQEIEQTAREVSGLNALIAADMGNAAASTQKIVDYALSGVDVQVAAHNFVEGMAKGMYSGAGVVQIAGTDIAGMGADAMMEQVDQYIQVGLDSLRGNLEGMFAGRGEAISVYERISQELLGGFELPIGHASPSKAFIEIGYDNMMGLIIGTKRGLQEALSVQRNSASRVFDIFYDAYLNMSSLGDINLAPTITPVVDMTNVNNAAKQINWDFNKTNKLSFAAINNAKKAQSINTVMALDPPSSRMSSTPVTNNYNFTQNNTSPKALSRIDLYRDTNNAMSMLKALTTTAVVGTAKVFLRGGK